MISSKTINNWIIVENPFSTRPYTKFNAKHYQEILHDSSDSKTKQLNLFKKAIEKEHAVGKWMLRISPDHVNEAWEWIKTNTLLGKLGCSANTSKLKRGQHTICVHTFFDDIENTIRVHKILIERFCDILIVKELEYKPDIFGYLGIYGKRYDIEPSVHIDYFLGQTNYKN